MTLIGPIWIIRIIPDLTKKIPGAAGDHERRLQRLQEILVELVALTDWKKLRAENMTSVKGPLWRS
jgi:hypothetical protein